MTWLRLAAAEFGVLDKYQWPKDQYAIFGSGPLAVRGIKPLKDVDVTVTQELWDRLLAEGHRPDSRGVIVLDGAIDVWRGYPGVNVDAVIAGAEMINGYPFATLEAVKAWKQAFGRDKDKADLALLEQWERRQTASS